MKFRPFIYLAAAIFIIYKLSNHEHGLFDTHTDSSSLELVSYDNKTFNLSQFYNQDKYILLNFWASWCSSCVKELPALSQISKNYKNKNLIIIGAALDSPAQDVKKLVEQHHLNYIIAKVSNSEADKWDAHSLPTTYLLNPKGEIIWAKAGELSFGELNEKLTMLKNQ